MNQPVLICTDLDGTLIPDGGAPESPNSRALFARLVARPEVSLAYVTGRHQQLVETAIAEFTLPLPDFVIGDVGTTIYEVGDGEWSLWQSWRDQLEKQWPPGSHSDLQSRLRDVSGIRLQELSKQSDLKLSYYVADEVDLRTLLDGVRQRLGEQSSSTRLIFSRDREGTGLFDLIPRSAGKLSSIVFLLERKGFEAERTVFCGDSGNDMQVLTSDLPSVLVANADPVVRSEARKRAAVAGHWERLYEAEGGFLGMNGNYAAGVLEGIAHWLPETVKWVE